MSASRHVLILIALCVVLGLPPAVRAYDVDCDSRDIPANATGEMLVDLDNTCPTGQTGIRLGANATLRMNGHTLLGGGIMCGDGKCTVVGPGQVVGAGTGINASLARRLVVTDVEVSGNSYGIYQTSGKLIATGVVANDNAFGGILGVRLFLDQVTANNNGSVDHSGSGIEGIIVKATNVTANGNLVAGITGFRRVLATNVTTNGNQIGGIQTSGGCKLKAVNAIGNERGALCYTGVIDGSILTGNSVADIIAGEHGPRVRNTTCDNSFRPGSSPFPGSPAGLCANN